MAHSISQIIATLGPASRSEETILKMAQAQMDLVRLNFSHGKYSEHKRYIENLRQVEKRLNRKIPIIQDLSGPRVQNGRGHHFQKGKKKSFTSKDKRDLLFGLEQRVDYIAASYVGKAQDIFDIRHFLQAQGKKLPIIAKIERKQAVKNLKEIIQAADAIMVARGDLGNEFPLEKIPFLEKEIIALARRHKKPVITATQMLLSMVENELPTRAEVVDVAQAILDGSDAVMLSEETAIGRHPVLAVRMM